MAQVIDSIFKTRQAVLVAVMLSLSFAFMGVWIRMMGDSFDDFQQVYIRTLLAGLIALFVFRNKLNKKLFVSLSTREWLVYISRALVGYLFGVASFTVAIQNTNLATVSFISSIPTLGLLAFIMFREKIPWKSVPFILISCLGVFLLTGVNISNLHMGLGEIASIVGALGFNISFLMSRLHKKDRNNFENTTMLLLLGWIPVFLISMVMQENVVPEHVSVLSWVGLILAAIFNIVGLYAVNYVFTNLKAYVAGNILLLEGIWSLILGFLLFAEPITMSLITGGLLIVASAVAVNQIDKRNQEAQTTELN